MEKTPYELHQELWASLVTDVDKNQSARGARDRSRRLLALVVELLHGSRTKAVSHPLMMEAIRISSRAIRRHHGLISCTERLLPEAVDDQTRSLVEILFQAFYLLRSPDPEQAALDAANLSAMSWARKADRLIADGYVPPTIRERPDVRAQLEQEVFSKYAGRRPRFYADLTARETAEKAGLLRVYDMTYSGLSTSTHNEPIIELNAIRRKTTQGLELAVVPSTTQVEQMYSTFLFGSQVAGLAAAGGLSLFADVDSDRARSVFNEVLAQNGQGDWIAELQTMATKWAISWQPPSGMPPTAKASP